MELIRAARAVYQEGCNLLQTLGFHKILAKVDVMNSRIESESARAAAGLDNAELRSDSKGNGSNKLFDAAPLRTEVMNKLNLPRVIVIGDEKAGKSSTLERFSMVEVLPRDVAFCTRQPVVLKLRYNPDIPQDAPRFVLTIPNDLEGSQAIFQEFDDVVVIRGLIEERMVAIKESGKGILMDSEVIVEIHSSGVPSIDLVDLPGLISVLVEEPGEPDNLAELSELCTKKYLAMESTGAVVCVLDATTQNLRTSKAIRVVQEMRDSLKANAIGVFSKTDLTRDSNWRDKVGADFKSPFYKVENWIRGYDDKSGNLAFLRNFRSGFVALKNRQTDSAREQNVTLWGHNQIEMDFFCNSQMSSCGEKAFLRPNIDPRCDESLASTLASSPNPFLTPALSKTDSGMMLSDYGIRVLGLNALLQKIDRVIRRHIGQTWVPQEVAEHEARKNVVTAHLEGLGCPPDELCLEDLQAEFCTSFAEKIKTVGDGDTCLLEFLSQITADCMLCGSSSDGEFMFECDDRVGAAADHFEDCQILQAEELQKEFDDIAPESSSVQSTLMRIRIRQLLERNFSEAMDAHDALPVLKKAIHEEIREALLDAVELPVRLVRFSDSLLQPLIDSSMRILSSNMPEFKAKAKAVFQHCILESYRDPFDPFNLEDLRENVFGTLYLDIKRALQEVVFQHLLIPCFVGKIAPFVLEAFENMSEVPPEDCADDRAAFQQRLITIDEIIAELESIDETPPGPEDDKAEPEQAVTATKLAQTSSKSACGGFVNLAAKVESRVTRQLSSRVASMQDSALCFLFTDLPTETTPMLLRSYLSVFGKIGSLDFDAAKRSALVVFASSVRIDRISTIQHRFMGMPIFCTRVSPPSRSASAAPAPALQFGAVASTPVSSGVANLTPAPVSIVPYPALPKTAFDFSAFVTPTAPKLAFLDSSTTGVPSFGGGGSSFGGGGSSALSTFGGGAGNPTSSFGGAATSSFGGGAGNPASSFGDGSTPSFGGGTNPAAIFGIASNPALSFGATSAPSFGVAVAPSVGGSGARRRNGAPSYGGDSNPALSFAGGVPPSKPAQISSKSAAGDAVNPAAKVESQLIRGLLSVLKANGSNMTAVSE